MVLFAIVVVIAFAGLVVLRESGRRGQTPDHKRLNTPQMLEQIIHRCLAVQEYGLAELEKDLVDFLRKD